MLISKEVMTKWCSVNIKYYTERGYIFTGAGTEIIVKTKDLKSRSSINVKVKCDCCKVEKTTRYSTYTKSMGKHNGRYLCDICNRKHNIKYSKDDVRKYIEQFGYKLVDDLGYHKMHDKIKIQCDKGHVYVSEFNSFKYGNRCSKCDKERWLKEGNPNYNFNLTEEERQSNISRHSNLEYRKWFKAIFKRDKYTCQCCGKCDGGILNAHHLNGYDWDIEHRLDIGNGITLCENCHKKFHHLYGYGNNTGEQFIKFIKTECTI